jgi:hypothetical protein
VAMFDMGTLTMKNYGLRRNCTTSIIYPEQIHMLNVDVGVTSETKPIEAETGLKETVINCFYVCLTVMLSRRIKSNIGQNRNKSAIPGP